jgi:Na+/phosphate symporter
VKVSAGQVFYETLQLYLSRLATDKMKSELNTKGKMLSDGAINLTILSDILRDNYIKLRLFS